MCIRDRMYVTDRRLCFYANFFGLEAKMSLRCGQSCTRCNAVAVGSGAGGGIRRLYACVCKGRLGYARLVACQQARNG